MILPVGGWQGRGPGCFYQDYVLNLKEMFFNSSFFVVVRMV